MSITTQTLLLSLLFLGILSLFPKNIDGFLHRQRPARCNIRPLSKIRTTTKEEESIVVEERWRRIPRGGSTVVDGDEDDEEEDEDDEKEAEDEEEDDEEDEEEETSKSSSMSNEPISITFKTNIGNPLIDVSLETTISKSRQIEHVKKTLSRMLPGRPPVGVINLRYDGMLLDDETVVGELFDDEDDDDEDDEEDTCKVLTLDMVPSVDPKFGTEMDTQINDLSTSDLFDAYTKNVAALHQNGNDLYQYSSTTTTRGLNDDDEEDDEEEEDHQKQTPSSQQPVSIRLQEQSLDIREKMVSQFSEEALELLSLEGPPLSDDNGIVTTERRGQRYRTSKGGVITGMKKVIQTNLNVNWPDTIRNFLLFLFFGILGGHSTISRNLLLLGAPMCFILQARPVKILIKQAFYYCSKPPSILLSLLPAPQQAILDFRLDTELQALYGIETQDAIDANEDEEFDDKLDEVIDSLEENDDEDSDDISEDDEVEDEDEEEEEDSDDDVEEDEQ